MHVAAVVESCIEFGEVNGGVGVVVCFSRERSFDMVLGMTYKPHFNL